MPAVAEVLADSGVDRFAVIAPCLLVAMPPIPVCATSLTPREAVPANEKSMLGVKACVQTTLAPFCVLLFWAAINPLKSLLVADTGC